MNKLPKISPPSSEIATVFRLLLLLLHFHNIFSSLFECFFVRVLCESRHIWKIFQYRTTNSQTQSDRERKLRISRFRFFHCFSFSPIDLDCARSRVSVNVSYAIVWHSFNPSKCWCMCACVWLRVSCVICVAEQWIVYMLCSVFIFISSYVPFLCINLWWMLLRTTTTTVAAARSPHSSLLDFVGRGVRASNDSSTVYVYPIETSIFQCEVLLPLLLLLRAYKCERRKRCICVCEIICLRFTCFIVVCVVVVAVAVISRTFFFRIIVESLVSAKA